jgi:hypothetical protein
MRGRTVDSYKTGLQIVVKGCRHERAGGGEPCREGKPASDEGDDGEQGQGNTCERL